MPQQGWRCETTKQTAWNSATLHGESSSHLCLARCARSKRSICFTKNANIKLNLSTLVGNLVGLVISKALKWGCNSLMWTMDINQDMISLAESATSCWLLRFSHLYFENSRTAHDACEIALSIYVLGASEPWQFAWQQFSAMMLLANICWSQSFRAC